MNNQKTLIYSVTIHPGLARTVLDFIGYPGVLTSCCKLKQKSRIWLLQAEAAATHGVQPNSCSGWRWGRGVSWVRHHSFCLGQRSASVGQYIPCDHASHPRFPYSIPDYFNYNVVTLLTCVCVCKNSFEPLAIFRSFIFISAVCVCEKERSSYRYL